MTEDALDWYKREVCGKNGHAHGPEGLRDCLLTTYAALNARSPTGPR